MEMLAGWVPTTPEMEVKVLFGRHVWDCAQHADALGRRAFELRAPLHYTLPAVERYRNLLRDAAEMTATSDRVDAFYRVICPGLVERYRNYIGKTDALMDEPTVRILENVLRDYERMSTECERLTIELPPRAPSIGVQDWRAHDQAIGSVVAHPQDDQRGARA